MTVMLVRASSSVREVWREISWVERWEMESWRLLWRVIRSVEVGCWPGTGEGVRGRRWAGRESEGGARGISSMS